jgi:hypothetical protein
LGCGWKLAVKLTSLETNLCATNNSYNAFIMELFAQQVTFQQNWEICCSLGMTPISLDSAYEQQCLSNLTKSSSWTGNHNYWTGGTQQGCRNSWGWCGSAAGPVGISDDIKWETGQPDNLGGRQDCIHLKNIQGAGLQMTDRNCTDRYILACKVIIDLVKFFWFFKTAR